MARGKPNKMKLAKLGYGAKWVEYGFVTEALLEAQLHEFGKGEDPNPEHYRYASFLNWLKSKEQLTDLEIERYIDLAKEEPDQPMAGSAMRELVLFSQLTDEQFEFVKEQLSEFGGWTDKLIAKATLKRKPSR